jgi:hypothetical protein
MKQIYMFFIIAFFVITITFIAGFFQDTNITSYAAFGSVPEKTGTLYIAASLIFGLPFLLFLVLKYREYKTKKQNCM